MILSQKYIFVFFTLLWSNGWFLWKSHCQPCDTGFSEEYKSLPVSPIRQAILFFDWYPNPPLCQFSPWFWFICTKPAQASKDQQLTPDTISYLLSLGHFIAHSIWYYFNIRDLSLFCILSAILRAPPRQVWTEGVRTLVEQLPFTPQIWQFQANLHHIYIKVCSLEFLCWNTPLCYRA